MTNHAATLGTSGRSSAPVIVLGHRVRTRYTGPTPYLTCPRPAPCRSCGSSTYYRDRSEAAQCQPCRDAELHTAIAKEVQP